MVWLNVPEWSQNILMIWWLCELYVIWGSGISKVWNVFCIIRHRPYLRDAKMPHWSGLRQKDASGSCIMTRKSGCHPNNSHTPTRTTTSITYSLVLVAIHQNNAYFCVETDNKHPESLTFCPKDLLQETKVKFLWSQRRSSRLKRSRNHDMIRIDA